MAPEKAASGWQASPRVPNQLLKSGLPSMMQQWPPWVTTVALAVLWMVATSWPEASDLQRHAGLAGGPAPADRAREIARSVRGEMALVELGIDDVVVEQDVQQVCAALGQAHEVLEVLVGAAARGVGR